MRTCLQIVQCQFCGPGFECMSQAKSSRSGKAGLLTPGAAAQNDLNGFIGGSTRLKLSASIAR